MQESLKGKKRRNSKEEPPYMSEVNILLLGSVGAGKSASGNTIIGGHTLNKDCFCKPVTRSCESAQTEVNKQTITVIDTVGLSDKHVKITETQTQIEQILQNKNIDVFLLVTELGQTFRKEKSEVVKWIRNNFGAKALKRTIVLFTHGDLIQKPIEDYLSKHEALQSVVDQCSGRFHIFNNKDKNQAQVTELLEKINRLRVMNGYSRYTKRDYGGAQKSLRMKIRATGAAVGAVTAAITAVGIAAAGGVEEAAGAAVVASAKAVATAAVVGGVTGAASGAAVVGGVLEGVLEGAAARGVAAAAGTVLVGLAGATVGLTTGADMGAALGGVVAAAVGAAVGRAAVGFIGGGAIASAGEGSKVAMGGVSGGVAGAVVGAAAGSVLSTVGSVAVMAAGGAVLGAAVVGAGIYFMARKCISRKKD